MNKSVFRFFTPGRIILLSILFALVMNTTAGWIVQKLKEDYRIAQDRPGNTEVLDENRYYHYLKFFGSMDVRYKSGKSLRYESVSEELAFYQNSLGEWEKGLNALVSDITATMAEEEAIKFTNSQNLWSDSKEKLAQEASSFIRDSRDKEIGYAKSQIESVRTRAYELLKNYKHILESSF